jgi:hypothetical protein
MNKRLFLLTVLLALIACAIFGKLTLVLCYILYSAIGILLLIVEITLVYWLLAFHATERDVCAALLADDWRTPLEIMREIQKMNRLAWFRPIYGIQNHLRTLQYHGLVKSRVRRLIIRPKKDCDLDPEYEYQRNDQIALRRKWTRGLQVAQCLSPDAA